MNWGNTLSPSAIQHLHHHCNAMEAMLHLHPAQAVPPQAAAHGGTCPSGLQKKKCRRAQALIGLVPCETAAAGRFASTGFHASVHSC